jgi:hypothetical protein
MLRLIIIALIGFLIFRFIRNIFLGPSPRGRVKNDKPGTEEDFQQKHRNKIEDADFEELD